MKCEFYECVKVKRLKMLLRVDTFRNDINGSERTHQEIGALEKDCCNGNPEGCNEFYELRTSSKSRMGIVPRAVHEATSY